MNTILSVRATRAITWAATVAVSFGLAMPAAAFQQLPQSMVYEFSSQSGTVEGDAHVVRAEAGDTVEMSLTVINRSQNPAGQVWYGADALIDEVAPYEGAHEIRVGTLMPQDGTPAFLDESSFINDNMNRFVTYNGAPVYPGQSMTLTWDVMIADDAADGTYDMYYGLLREHDEWGRQWKNGAYLPSADIFTRFIIGEGGTDGSGDLEGGAGDITVNGLSTYSNEEVGQDSEDVSIFAFEVEADDESDVELTSMKLEFYQQTAADSRDLDDYATEVSIWLDGEEVGRADVDEFSESSDIWSKSMGLDGAIVRAGETERFVVAISALSNLDSGDIDTDDWQGGVSSIRFLDGEGVTTTEAVTLDIDDDTVDEEVEQEFDFASFGAAEDVELVFALNDDDEDINEAHVIDVDDSDTTDNVEILSFTMEAEGNSDINVSELHVLITSTEAAGAHFDEPGDIVSNVTLWWGDDEIASDTLSTQAGADDAEVAVFDDLDIDIDAGETEEFMVKVDLISTGGVLDDGDTIKAEIDGTRVDLTEAEDETGEDLTTTPDQLTGTALGEASAVYGSGIMVEFVSSSATRTFTADESGEDDQGTFKITFDVTAFDGDIRIDNSSEVGAATATGTYTLDNGAILAGEVFTATINGTAVEYTVVADDLDDGGADVDALAVANKIALAIDANGTVGPLVNAVVTSGAGTETITLTATTPGTAGNYTTVAADDSVGNTFAAGAAAMAGGAAAANAAGEGVQFDETDTVGMLPVLATDILSSSTTDSEDTANTFEVDEGKTRRFTLTVIYSADSVPNDGSMYVSLTSINWGTATNDTNANYYSTNLGDFKTPYLFLNGIA